MKNKEEYQKVKILFHKYFFLFPGIFTLQSFHKMLWTNRNKSFSHMLVSLFLNQNRLLIYLTYIDLII